MNCEQHLTLLRVIVLAESSFRLEWDQLTALPYGDRFRKHRRLMSQVLNSHAIGAYRELQTNNVKVLLRGLLDHPENFEHHILRFVAPTPLPSTSFIHQAVQSSLHHYRQTDVRSQH